MIEHLLTRYVKMVISKHRPWDCNCDSMNTDGSSNTNVCRIERMYLLDAKWFIHGWGGCEAKMMIKHDEYQKYCVYTKVVVMILQS